MIATSAVRVSAMAVADGSGGRQPASCQRRQLGTAIEALAAAHAGAGPALQPAGIAGRQRAGQGSLDLAAA